MSNEAEINTFSELADIATLLINQKQRVGVSSSSPTGNEQENTFHPLAVEESLKYHLLTTQLRNIAQDFLANSDFQAADVWVQKSSQDFEQLFSIVDKDVSHVWHRLNNQYAGRQTNLNNAHSVGSVITKTIFEAAPVLEIANSAVEQHKYEDEFQVFIGIPIQSMFQGALCFYSMKENAPPPLPTTDRAPPAWPQEDLKRKRQLERSSKENSAAPSTVNTEDVLLASHLKRLKQSGVPSSGGRYDGVTEAERERGIYRDMYGGVFGSLSHINQRPPPPPPPPPPQQELMFPQSRFQQPHPPSVPPPSRQSQGRPSAPDDQDVANSERGIPAQVPASQRTVRGDSNGEGGRIDSNTDSNVSVSGRDYMLNAGSRSFSSDAEGAESIPPPPSNINYSSSSSVLASQPAYLTAQEYYDRSWPSQHGPANGFSSSGTSGSGYTGAADAFGGSSSHVASSAHYRELMNRARRQEYMNLLREQQLYENRVSLSRGHDQSQQSTHKDHQKSQQAHNPIQFPPSHESYMSYHHRPSSYRQQHSHELQYYQQQQQQYRQPFSRAGINELATSAEQESGGEGDEAESEHGETPQLLENKLVAAKATSTIDTNTVVEDQEGEVSSTEKSTSSVSQRIQGGESESSNPMHVSEHIKESAQVNFESHSSGSSSSEEAANFKSVSSSSQSIDEMQEACLKQAAEIAQISQRVDAMCAQAGSLTNGQRKETPPVPHDTTTGIDHVGQKHDTSSTSSSSSSSSSIVDKNHMDKVPTADNANKEGAANVANNDDPFIRALLSATKSQPPQQPPRGTDSHMAHNPTASNSDVGRGESSSDNVLKNAELKHDIKQEQAVPPSSMSPFPASFLHQMYVGGSMGRGGGISSSFPILKPGGGPPSLTTYPMNQKLPLSSQQQQQQQQRYSNYLQQFSQQQRRPFYGSANGLSSSNPLDEGADLMAAFKMYDSNSAAQKAMMEEARRSTTAGPSSPSSSEGAYKKKGAPRKNGSVLHLCLVDGCPKLAQGATNYCIAHGGGNRCIHPGCKHGARDKFLCATHGGGKRCSKEGCGKAAVGKYSFCTAHGGGRRCEEPGCNKAAQSNTKNCVRHGGGKRCTVEGCKKVARGKTKFCTLHFTEEQTKVREESGAHGASGSYGGGGFPLAPNHHPPIGMRGGSLGLGFPPPFPMAGLHQTMRLMPSQAMASSMQQHGSSNSSRQTVAAVSPPFTSFSSVIGSKKTLGEASKEDNTKHEKAGVRQPTSTADHALKFQNYQFK